LISVQVLQKINLVKKNIATVRSLKGTRPIVAVTAYDTVMARLADAAGVDLILVGDSVGTVQLGFETTVPVRLEMMLHHTAAVARARVNALVVADIPFAVAHDSFSRLLNAGRELMQTAGAEAIKIEGGAHMAAKIERLTQAGIPVLGHIGLLPQNYHQLGGYRKFGLSEPEKLQLQADAEALQEAGCFALVCEMIDASLAGSIAQSLQIPLIGIGSGPRCDGQILVSNDLLGLTTQKVPPFVKKYTNLADQATKALKAYVTEVHEQKFPS
jgi:3-methyl-2-oxobutanoate hydroxymethyltransferase